MHAFNGMLTAIIQAGETAGEIVFTAKANGGKPEIFVFKRNKVYAL